MTTEKNIKYDEESGVPDASGIKYWYLNSKLHRLDGPAIEWANGSKEWYLNDKLHREDGPACEYADGDKEWYQNGQLHRLDGPAYECSDGYKEWYISGKKAIKIKDQTIEVGKKIIIDNDVGIILKHLEGIFYEVLLGNQKKITYCIDKI